MSRNAKILIDLAVFAAAYGIWLLPKWRPLGRRTLTVYTLMYGCLAGIALFTLMPVLAALPFCFDHPYVPMHMAPFEDVILRHGDRLGTAHGGLQFLFQDRDIFAIDPLVHVSLLRFLFFSVFQQLNFRFL